MTEFPKHYDHQEAEGRLHALWDSENLHRFDAEAAKSGKPVFSVDTPPPYVSADHLHVGHAMSYSQAEFIVRYRRMQGDVIFYPMGFDDNGLPTERFVEKKYKINKNKISRKEFIDLCLQETAKGAETYRNLWRALGISVDWRLSYSTIDKHCQRTAQKSFLELFQAGLLVRREEPIIWCYQCQTSLAQADVETEQQNSALHDIAFKSPEGTDLVISTTRPELIPACVALYVNPDDDRYRSLVGKVAVVPLTGHRVPIKTDAAVEKEFGTGLMMVCTWGDMEDVRKWREHGLATRLIFKPNGQINDLGGPLAGVYYSKARETVLKMLKESGEHRKTVPVAHHVGVHERCNTGIDFNLAPQWFIRALDFKEELLKRGDELVWHPSFMKVRYEQWVRDLKWDWNISRQRFYGVPFPVWYCRSCKHPIVPALESLPVDPLVDASPVSACPSCKSTEIDPEPDVMDTWMTSSLTPLISANWATKNPGKEDPRPAFGAAPIYPMSIRPQAFEIIRTWLFYTVLKSHLHTKSLPWKSVMISGWGLDDKGRKISKSAGNFVDAHQIISKYSADALRYWAAGSNLGHDLRFNESDVAAGRKIVVKMWNATKFVVSNLDGKSLGHLAGGMLSKPPSVMMDRWVLAHLQDCVRVATENLDVYEYSAALRAIERFFWATYCDNYLEIVKDRFWNAEEYSEAERTSAIETLYVVSRTLLQLFAPFMPYITEELWQRFYRPFEGTNCIHISKWPTHAPQLRSDQAFNAGNLLLVLLTPVRKFKSLQKLHQNHQLQELTVYAPRERHPEIESILADLKSATRSKAIRIAEGTGQLTSEDAALTLDLTP